MLEGLGEVALGCPKNTLKQKERVNIENHTYIYMQHKDRREAGRLKEKRKKSS